MGGFLSSAAVVALAVSPANGVVVAPVAKEAERARAEARRLGVERRQKREEMARAREEMRKLDASKGG